MLSNREIRGSDEPGFCPICEEVDDDGLEACASCYNEALAKASKYQAAYKSKCEELHALRLQHINVSVELLKLKEVTGGVR